MVSLSIKTEVCAQTPVLQNKKTSNMKKKLFLKLKYTLFVIVLCCLSTALNAQKAQLEKEIKYLSEFPIIDGKLDSNLISIELREFPVIIKTSDNNPDTKINYRLAYGSDFFYVYIEAEAEKLIYRDRAYQNGDGFHMVLARPKPNNNPTDEFYVLGCSAVNKESMEWSRNIFWYYNVDDIFKRTSKDTKLMFAESEGKISFELLLPWKDVYPYHPWLSESIGFNLCFVKAIGDQDNNYYFVRMDNMGAENSKRDYQIMKFEVPNHVGEPQTYFLPDRNTIDDTEILSGRSVTVSSGEYNEDIIVKILSGENYLLDYTPQQYNCKKGLTTRSFDITKNPIPPGGYKVEWYSRKNKSKGESYLTSIPKFDKELFNTELDKVQNVLCTSSFQTIKHRIFEIDKELNEIKPYESCGKQRLAIEQIQSEIKSALNGIDKIAMSRGFVRKAYLSKLDSTTQPYMVYIPENYDPDITYPLVIYLHGSASNETNLISSKNKIPDGFIALAPNGRGPSNCYSWDFAQNDISEAIDAVCQSYSIDKDNILLTGFSMGGYGVYRTFFEMPDRFKALAIFSGHPNLANQWSGEDNLYPDFTKKQYLKKFKNVPIFIFHGKRDRNCSYETTEGIIKILNNVGAKVKFVTDENKGHESPGHETIFEYNEWVRKTLDNKK